MQKKEVNNKTIRENGKVAVTNMFLHLYVKTNISISIKCRA